MENRSIEILMPTKPSRDHITVFISREQKERVNKEEHEWIGILWKKFVRDIYQSLLYLGYSVRNPKGNQKEWAEKTLLLIQEKLSKNLSIWDFGDPFGNKICGRCLGFYSEKDLHTPRYLPCSHKICLGCITELFEGRGITCPFCVQFIAFKKPTDVPIHATAAYLCS